MVRTLEPTSPVDGDGERRSALTEATWLFAGLARQGMKNLTFTRARVVAELILRYAQAALHTDGQQAVERVAAYPAPVAPAQRRAIEQQALPRGPAGGGDERPGTRRRRGGARRGADGRLSARSPAPGSRQGARGARAARRWRLLVLQDNPLDQFLGRNPDALFGRGWKARPQTPRTLTSCSGTLRAAAEKPLGPADVPLFGDVLPELEAILVEAGRARGGGGTSGAEVATRRRT